MELSAFRAFAPAAAIVQDGRFASLGFDLTHPHPEMLTYAGSAPFLASSLASPAVSCVLTTARALEGAGPLPAGKGVAVVDDPRLEFFRFHNHLCTATDFYGRPSIGRRGSGCRVSPHASVAAEVALGDGVVIEDFVKIYDNVTIGDGAFIASGSVLGGEGFQYLHGSAGVLKVHHAGGVTLGAGVELHPHCVVDRGIFAEDTALGDDCKLDASVYFAHRSRAGARCRIAAGALIMGSVVIGDDAWIGPQSVVSNSLTLGDRVFVALGAVVVRDLPSDAQVAGNFAVDKRAFILRNLEAMPPR